jgi:hypothetical protein
MDREMCWGKSKWCQLWPKSNWGQLLVQPAQKLSAETNQRIEALEGVADKIESQLVQYVAGLSRARHALAVSVEQCSRPFPMMARTLRICVIQIP